MKKYRSLSDVYEDVAFNNVPKPPRQRVIGEDYEVYGRNVDDPEGKPENLGVADDKYYKSIKHNLVAKGVGGYQESVLRILEIAGWNTADAEESKIVKEVVDIFVRHQVDGKIVGKIEQKKKSGNLGTLEKSISKKDVWNVIECFDPLYKDLTPNWKVLICDLMRVVSGSDNETVAVGPGEVATSIFTNAGKGNHGDLWLASTGVEIEMKADGGRLGSSNYTHNWPEYAKNFLSGHGIDINQQYISEYTSKVLTLIDTSITQLQNNGFRNWILELHPQSEELGETEVERTPIPSILPRDDVNIIYDDPGGVVALLKDIKDNIETSTGVESLQKLAGHIDTINAARNENGVSVPGGVATGAIPTSTILMGFRDHKNEKGNQTTLSQGKLGNLEKVLYAVNKIHSLRELPDNYNWQKTGEMVWNTDHGISIGDLATAFIEMRSDALDNDRDSLRDGAMIILKDIVGKKDSKLYSKKGGKIPGVTGDKAVQVTEGQLALRKLQAALQMTGYQTVHGFHYLTIINPSSGDAVSIEFKSTDAGQKLVDTYKQLIRHDAIHVPNAGVDDRNKGVGIALGKKGTKGVCSI